MPTKIETLKAGDVLYDVHREKAGNTTMSREGCWEVDVREVGVDERGPWALLAWNGNPPRHKTYYTTTYKRAPKEWIANDIYGGGRRCHMCRNTEDQGHRDDCEHPRAIAARKRAAKENAASSRLAAAHEFDADLRNGGLRDERNPDAVVFEPEHDGEEWQW